MTEHDPAIRHQPHVRYYFNCAGCVAEWEAHIATDPLHVPEEPVRAAPWNRRATAADRFWLLVAFCALCFVAGLVFGRAA